MLGPFRRRARGRWGRPAGGGGSGGWGGGGGGGGGGQRGAVVAGDGVGEDGVVRGDLQRRVPRVAQQQDVADGERQQVLRGDLERDEADADVDGDQLQPLGEKVGGALPLALRGLRQLRGGGVVEGRREGGEGQDQRGRPPPRAPRPPVAGPHHGAP